MTKYQRMAASIPSSVIMWVAGGVTTNCLLKSRYSTGSEFSACCDRTQVLAVTAAVIMDDRGAITASSTKSCWIMNYELLLHHFSHGCGVVG